jgi:hypothetical protein
MAPIRRRMNVADTADRAFVNFGIAAENLAQTEAA